MLLDRQVADGLTQALTVAIEQDSTDRVVDLHCWSIGHQRYAAELVVVSDAPQPPAYYKARIPARLNVVHATVEVHRCGAHAPLSSGSA